MSGWHKDEKRSGGPGGDVWTHGCLLVYMSLGRWRWFIEGGNPGGDVNAANLGEAQRLATLAAHEAVDRLKAALPPMPEEM